MEHHGVQWPLHRCLGGPLGSGGRASQSRLQTSPHFYRNLQKMSGQSCPTGCQISCVTCTGEKLFTACSKSHPASPCLLLPTVQPTPTLSWTQEKERTLIRGGKKTKKSLNTQLKSSSITKQSSSQEIQKVWENRQKTFLLEP